MCLKACDAAIALRKGFAEVVMLKTNIDELISTEVSDNHAVVGELFA